MPQILMPYTVHLDHTLRVTPLNTLFAKGDSAAHRFELTILRAGVQVDLTGCTVLCKFYRMADSTVVSVPGSVEDGKAVSVLKKACYDYIGRFALTIAIKNGEEEETTVFYGDGYMHGQNADTAISGEYIIYDINTLLERIEEIDAATQAANTATENANTAASNANTARDAANTAANTANTAAINANTANETANAAAGKIDNMTVSATPVETGTATAALSTVDGHYHLALGLPKGDTGATPRISVQVQTGAAGSEAQVNVSGTAEEPVIILTIPKGDTGDIGALTINGKTPDAAGRVTLGIGDIDGLQTAIESAGSVKTVAGKAPDEAGNVAISAADVGARASDWMPTAAQVGAASAEEVSALKVEMANYRTAVNLLDNSDFTNLVAQAGIGGNHGTVTYAADRWILDSGTVSYEEGVGLTLSGTIRQKLKLPPTGNTSAFVGMTSGAASISYADGAVTITSGGGVIKWAALYEGSYTDENLPPFVAPDPVLEMLKCQIYCFVVNPDWASVHSGKTTGDGTGMLITFRTPVVMYGAPNSVPSVVVDNLGLVDFYTVSGGIAGATNVAVQTSTQNGVSLLFATNGNVTPNTPCVARLNTRILLSRDL